MNDLRRGCLMTLTFLAGCGGGSSPVSPDGGGPDAACPSGMGSGQVSLVINAPVMLAPTVHLTGPGLAAPMSLVPGAPVSVPAGGGYRITARRAKLAPGATEYVGKAYHASKVEFAGCIAAGSAATATVTYALEPGSGKMWTTPSNGAGAIAAYDEAQLHLAAPQAPSVTRSMGLTSVSDLAFDSFGNLWASDSGVGGGIVAYAVQTLGSAADQRPALKLTDLEQVRALAFDAAGDLWAAQSMPGGTDRVRRLAAASLAFDPTAATTITRPGVASTMTSDDLKGLADMTFDAAGNLWLTSDATNAVVKIASDRLAAGGTVTAAVVLRARKTTGPLMFDFSNPRAVTLDAAGNLWVGFVQGPTRFTAAQLAASATIDDPLFVEPMGMGGAGVSEAPQAIDAQMGMWLSRTNIGMPAALVRLPPSALAAGGPQATTPNMPSDGLGNGSDNLVFNPTPPGLPIRD